MSATHWTLVLAGGDLLLNVAMDVSSVVGVGEGVRAAYVGAKVAAHIGIDVAEHAAAHAGEDAVEHVAEHVAEDAAEHVVEDEASHVAEGTADHVAADDGGKETVVIGESMSRVRNYVAKNGGRYYKTWDDLGRAGQTVTDMYDRNRTWIRAAMKRGARIVNVGFDADRPTEKASVYYMMELFETRDYPGRIDVNWPGSDHLIP